MDFLFDSPTSPPSLPQEVTKLGMADTWELLSQDLGQRTEKVSVSLSFSV